MTFAVPIESENRPLVQNGRLSRSKDIEEIIRKNDQTKLIDILQNNVDDILNPLNKDSCKTALHFAALEQASDCVSEIIERIPPQNLNDYIDTPTRGGQTALHIAAENLDSQVIDILLGARAYPNVRDDGGFTPLHYLADALKNISPEKGKKLLDSTDSLLNCPRTDLDAINKMDISPLELAARQIKSSKTGHETIRDFCKKLVRKGAKVTPTVVKNLGQEFISSFEILPTTQRMTRSTTAKMFDYITKNEPQHIRKIWEENKDEENKDKEKLRCQKIKMELSQVANKFFGSKRILYYIVDECNEEAVSLFLEELNVDPMKESFDGEFPLHRALARSKYAIVDALIKKMAESEPVDLSPHSFSLIKKALEVEFGTSREESSRCLERLFHSDVRMDVNQKEEVSNQTALHFAAALSNQEAIEILMANGAYLGQHHQFDNDDRGTILKALMCKTLRSALDKCISLDTSTSTENSRDDLLSRDYCLQLDYKFLLPSYKDVSKKEEAPHHNEAATLYEISQSKDHEETLKHPLIQVFLFAKWQRVMPLYFLNLFFYFLFVILLTAFMYTSKSVRILERMERTGNATDPVGLMEQLSGYRTQRNVLMVFVLLITFYMTCKEIFQIRTTKLRSYFILIENYLEWILIIAVFVACFVNLPVDATRHLAAWAMIVAWYEFVLVLGRLPPLAIYITLLRHVSFNFLKLIVLFGFLIIAFSISFNIIFQESSDLQTGEEFNDFANFWTTLPRAIVMATGEFEYSSYSEEFSTANVVYATSTVLIFLVFLFLIFLVMMNVMTGLAVTDAKEIVEDAILYSLKSRLDLVYLNEQFFLGVKVLQRFLPRLQILNNPNRRLKVKVNSLPKAERITYWHGSEPKTCKLDNRTAEVLRSHRLEHLNDLAGEANPSDQMLQMLREVRDMVESRAIV